MANPRKRTSQQKKHKRRTHYKATAPTLTICQNCKSAVVYHRVCPECGYYKGKPAIEKKVAV